MNGDSPPEPEPPEEEKSKWPRLSGPPEPVLPQEGKPRLVYVRQNETEVGRGPEIGTQKLAVWECQQCRSEVETKIVDGEIKEPTQCVGCDRNGPFEPAGVLTDDYRQAALRADEMWYPPSGVSDEGFMDLWGDVREFLFDYWDSRDPEVYEGLTAFALSTWVRENMEFVPHLMLMGKTTGGKTRLLNTLARVSYRGIVGASVTPASLFRLVDKYDVSYYISEYHGLDKDARREVANIVRAGQKEGELVTRAEQSNGGQHEPMSFDPFTHMAVATQYTPDDDIVNRCIQVKSSPANREMPPTFEEDRATQIRNRLLFARYRLLDSFEWEVAEEQAFAYLKDRGITGRTREKLVGLLTVAHVWESVDRFEPFVDVVEQQDIEAAADTEDAVVVEVIRNLALDELKATNVLGDADPWDAIEIPLGDVAERYEEMTGVEKSNSWVGHVRARLDLDKSRKRDGVVIDDDNLEEKLKRLCDEHNLDFEQSRAHDPAPELDPEDQYRGKCPECGNDGTMTHRDVNGGGGTICGDCAEDLRAAAKRERMKGD